MDRFIQVDVMTAISRSSSDKSVHHPDIAELDHHPES